MEKRLCQEWMFLNGVGEGWEEVYFNILPGCLATSRLYVNTVKVRSVVQNDQCLTVRMTAEELNISRYSVNR
jgi:hypothetical protein